MKIQTTVDVPPNRQVTLTLPPETPLGPMALTVNGESLVEDHDRRNPDTPEFREKTEHTFGLAVDLRDYRLHLTKLAEAAGQNPETVKAMLVPTPENKIAFSAWRDANRVSGGRR